MNKAKKDLLWDEAIKKCKLNDVTVKMAKEMGLNPLSLIKNIPNKNQKWKSPVSKWIEEMYEKQKNNAGRKKETKDNLDIE